MIGTKLNHKRLKWSIIGIETTNITPSLIIDINPKELNIAYKKIINRVRTLGGFLEEHWGDEMDVITGSGSTSMYYDADRGLTVTNRRSSESMQNFLRLVNIYRNNGAELSTKTNRINRVGRIRLEYDGKTYDGYFETFSIEETAEQPFVFTYSFTFKVQRTFGEYKVSKALMIDQFLEVLGY